MTTFYNKLVMIWDEARQSYTTLEADSFGWAGEIAECCGASGDQKAIGQQQTSFFNTMTDQAKSVFGDASSVFKDLVGTFSSIFKAGPNQEGMSAGQKANLTSQAITNTGQAYNNAKQAVGERIAAQGGGNTVLPSGAAIAPQLALGNEAAATTANELSQINEQDYALGRENWQAAASGLAGATGVFNPATSAAGAATNSGEAAANTANEIASQNNSWVNGAFGALGAVAGAATTGGLNLMKPATKST